MQNPVGQSRTARLTAALLARHQLAECMRTLNGEGILPMPLGGALLQQSVYQDLADRPLRHAQLLIPAGRFEDGVRALRRAGYEVSRPARHRVVAVGPGTDDLRVTLLGRPFPPGLYGLDGVQMFARGRIDEKCFDAVVVVADPKDVFAHLVGSFARARLGAKARERLRDFSAVASRFGLAARPLARHLEKHGLGRAARYTLSHADDAHSIKVLRALRPDPLGRMSAAVARRLTTRYGSGARISKIAPHLVNRSLRSAVFSLGARVALNVKSRLTRDDED